MIEPTEEQAEELKVAAYFEQLSTHPAWTLIMERVNSQVEEAHDQMVGLVAPLPEFALSALTRYQQRLIVKQDLEKFVAAHLENKKQILEELQGEQENGNDTESTD